MIKTEEINLGVALFSVNTLRFYVTTNDIPAQLSRENMIDKRRDKTRQDNVFFGVLYSLMYIDFIQII